MRQDVGAAVSPLDNNCDMERVVRSMEPTKKQANRRGAADAIGGATAADAHRLRAVRADIQQSVERASAPDC